MKRNDKGKQIALFTVIIALTAVIIIAAVKAFDTKKPNGGGDSVEALAEKQYDEAKTQINKIVKEGIVIVNKHINEIDSSKCKIDMKELLQNPELPTGCEITSLTSVLNFYGYDVSKLTMANDWLKKGKVGEVSAYEAFLGSPDDIYSFGCYAPVIKDAAERYLREQNSDLKVYDYSGRDFKTLYGEVLNGNPVIVWATMGMKESHISKTWELPGGKFSWIAGEHCLVLTGFDEDENIVYIMDPLEGNVSYDAEIFETRYNELLKQAVVIKR